jgi:hypothetical protein
MSKRDIVKRLRDPMIDLSYGDRLIAADHIERLCKALEGVVAYLDGHGSRNSKRERELLMAARAALKGQP